MISLSSQATIYPEGIHSLDEADRRCRHMLCIRNCSFFPILVLLSLLVLFAASAVGADVHGTVTNAQAASRLGRFRQRSSEQASSLLRGRMVRFTFPKYQRAVMCSRSAAWDTAHSPYPFSLQPRTIAKNFYSRLRRITSAEPSRSKYAATSSKPRIGRPSEI